MRINSSFYTGNYYAPTCWYDMAQCPYSGEKELDDVVVHSKERKQLLE